MEAVAGRKFSVTENWLLCTVTLVTYTYIVGTTWGAWRCARCGDSVNGVEQRLWASSRMRPPGVHAKQSCKAHTLPDPPTRSQMLGFRFSRLLCIHTFSFTP